MRNSWSGHSALRTPHSALRMGQVVIEYFVIFALVAMLTVISLTKWDDDVIALIQRFVGQGAEKVAGPNTAR